MFSPAHPLLQQQADSEAFPAALPRHCIVAGNENEIDETELAAHNEKILENTRIFQAAGTQVAVRRSLKNDLPPRFRDDRELAEILLTRMNDFVGGPGKNCRQL